MMSGLLLLWLWVVGALLAVVVLLAIIAPAQEQDLEDELDHWEQRRARLRAADAQRDRWPDPQRRR